MALSDTLNDITRTAPAAKNRVDILLDRLEGTEDHPVLIAALTNPLITGAALTRALRREYGNIAVKDFSVDNWRRSHNADVTGL